MRRDGAFGPVSNEATVGQPPRTNLLGVGISAVNMERALATIDGWIARREQRYVCLASVHSIMEARRDPSLRQTLNVSGLTTPDGMPLVWLSRLAGFRDVDRVYGPDLLLAVCQRSLRRGYRHFFYGGAPDVADRLARQLEQRFPGLQVAGVYCPPFRPLTSTEDEQVVQRINEARPDIVWVGLGAPKQERWMASHSRRLTAPVLLGVGAAFDFHSASKRQAPRWMQRNGLEWLFRLAQEPSRLWYRYLVYNPWFVLLVVAQMCGLVRYPLKEPSSTALGQQLALRQETTGEEAPC